MRERELIKRPFKPGIVNRTFENRTQSVDWVRLSSAIERNRTPHFQWVRFPNKSNSIEQIELNRTQSVWLCSIEFGNRTQSNTIKWISFDWLWWTYTKQAQSKPVKASFSCAFFTIYSITQTPFINCPRQLREQNRTKQSYHYSRGRISKLSYPFLFLANLQ